MKQYIDLLRAIKDRGVHKPAAREGMPSSQSLFGYQFRHDLSEGFPLLTTKKMFWKGVVVELLWFLRGDTNIKYLLDNGVNIWNEDAYNYYVKLHNRFNKEKPIPFEMFVDQVKQGNTTSTLSIRLAKYKLGDCGMQYGKVWRDWCSRKENQQFSQAIDQIQNLITSLKNTPESRRHILTAIDPAHDQDLALYWCHALVQFNCRPLKDWDRKILLSERPGWEGQLHNIDEDPSGEIMETCDSEGIPKYYLDCQLYQRSADVVLGVPFNIASYALLTHILCEICNMVPGEYIHTFGDVHIYDDHKASVEEQLGREPKELPKLYLGEALCSDLSSAGLDETIKHLSNTEDFDLMEYFEVENYNPHPPLENKAELLTGLKR